MEFFECRRLSVRTQGSRNFDCARGARLVQTGETVESDEAPQLTMVCAWCARVLVRGTSGEISHGICDDCLPGVITEILQKLEQEQANEPGEHETESRRKKPES